MSSIQNDLQVRGQRVSSIQNDQYRYRKCVVIDVSSFQDAGSRCGNRHHRTGMFEMF